MKKYIIFILLSCAPRALSNDKLIKINSHVIPLGKVRVTHYTKYESHGTLTSSGYNLQDQDAIRECAISRNWWHHKVKEGDLIWVLNFAQPCIALDTMAIFNKKHFRQNNWIDIYDANYQRALDFGIQHSKAFIIHPLTNESRNRLYRIFYGDKAKIFECIVKRKRNCNTRVF